MTLVFPTIQREELLYSAIGRYRDLFQYPGDRAIGVELFGSKDRTALLDLPLGLDNFVDCLPNGHPYTADILIQKHTSFPYHAHFLSDERRLKILDRMRRGGKGPSVPTLLGTGVRSQPRPRAHQFCIDCADDDLRSFGEPCWRRVHQLAGVFVCPTHGRVLQEGPPRQRNLVGVFVYHSLARSMAERLPIVLPDAPASSLRWLADQSLALLQATPKPISAAALRSAHRRLMSERGWISPGGRFCYTRAREAMLERWGRDLLRTWVDLESAKQVTRWLFHSTAPGNVGSGPALQHLLMAGAYGISIEEFLKEARKGERTRTVPECANPACVCFLPAAYRRTAKATYLATGDAYTCECCGLVFEETPGYAYNLRVIKAAPSWDNALAAAINKGASLAELLDRFGIAQRVLLCHADRLGLWRDEWGERSTDVLSVYEDRRIQIKAKKRASWLAYRDDNPHYTRTMLQRQFSKLYQWLRRHDRAWLLSQLPEALPVGPKRRDRKPSRKSSVDWEQRDRTLLPVVEAAVQRILHRHPPVRLTRAVIGREAGHRTLLWQENPRLPRCSGYIRSVLESVDIFVRRRIKVRVHEYIRAGVIPVYSDFLESCGIMWTNRHKYELDLRSGLVHIREGIHPGNSFLDTASDGKHKRTTPPE